MTANHIPTEDQIIAWCEKAAENSHFLNLLTDFERAEIKLYVEKQAAVFDKMPSAGQRKYYYMLAPYVEKLLALFNVEAPVAAEVSPAVVDSMCREVEAARLIRLSLDDVRGIFAELSTYTQGPRERAAAIAALAIGGYLSGSSYKLEKWFADNVGGKVGQKTISNALKFYRDNGEMSTKDEQNIFQAVQNIAKQKARN